MMDIRIATQDDVAVSAVDKSQDIAIPTNEIKLVYGPEVLV
jgi:hypothetical protein